MVMGLELKCTEDDGLCSRNFGLTLCIWLGSAQVLHKHIAQLHTKKERQDGVRSP